jgi:RNase P subunit RPR2
MKRKCPECEGENLKVNHASPVWFGENYITLICYDCGHAHRILFTDDELNFDDGKDPIKTEVLKNWVSG